jgi:hypothetical protein
VAAGLCKTFAGLLFLLQPEKNKLTIDDFNHHNLQYLDVKAAYVVLEAKKSELTNYIAREAPDVRDLFDDWHKII